MSSTEDILGRAEINDIEAILGVVNTDVDEVEHAVKDNADAIFTWDYTLARPALRKLYEKAKTGQWNATTDLPWDTEVDQEKVVAEIQVGHRHGHGPERSTWARPSRSGATRSGSSSASSRTTGR